MLVKSPGMVSARDFLAVAGNAFTRLGRTVCGKTRRQAGLPAEVKTTGSSAVPWAMIRAMTLIPLSPIDHVFTGRGAYPIEFVFSYAGAMDAGRLEESLRRALAVFPPVSSRFVRLPGGALAFEPYEGGCAFRVAESATGFEETERRTVFLDPVDGREGEPLGRVLLTRTPTGCVSLWPSRQPCGMHACRRRSKVLPWQPPLDLSQAGRQCP